jgi:hypothetical protein
MKKLFVLLVVLILAAGVALAQEENNNLEPVPAPAQATSRERPIELFNMEISVGFPVHWTNGRHNQEVYYFNPPDNEIYMEDRTVTANTSIGIAAIFNFTRGFGLALDMDFFFGAKIAGFAAPTSDYVSLAGANIFFGPIFYIFNNNILRIPLGIGAHMYYFQDDLWVPDLAVGSTQGAWLNRHEIQFGPAISLGVQFHFSRDIYIFSRTNVAIDLFRMFSRRWYDGVEYRDQINDEDYYVSEHFSINWLVKPSLGIGIKY